VCILRKIKKTVNQRIVKSWKRVYALTFNKALFPFSFLLSVSLSLSLFLSLCDRLATAGRNNISEIPRECNFLSYL